MYSVIAIVFFAICGSFSQEPRLDGTQIRYVHNGEVPYHDWERDSFDPRNSRLQSGPPHPQLEPSRRQHPGSYGGPDRPQDFEGPSSTRTEDWYSRKDEVTQPGRRDEFRSPKDFQIRAEPAPPHMRQEPAEYQIEPDRNKKEPEEYRKEAVDHQVEAIDHQNESGENQKNPDRNQKKPGENVIGPAEQLKEADDYHKETAENKEELDQHQREPGEHPQEASSYQKESAVIEKGPGEYTKQPSEHPNEVIDHQKGTAGNQKRLSEHPKEASDQKKETAENQEELDKHEKELGKHPKENNDNQKVLVEQTEVGDYGKVLVENQNGPGEHPKEEARASGEQKELDRQQKESGEHLKEAGDNQKNPDENQYGLDEHQKEAGDHQVEAIDHQNESGENQKNPDGNQKKPGENVTGPAEQLKEADEYQKETAENKEELDQHQKELGKNKYGLDEHQKDASEHLKELNEHHGGDTNLQLNTEEIQEKPAVIQTKSEISEVSDDVQVTLTESQREANDSVFRENPEQALKDVTTTIVPDVICELCSCANDVIDCNERGLKAFSIDDWNSLKNSDIKEVYMSGNSINTLEEFPKLPIRILNISDSNIENIEDKCFANLSELESLDLSKNRIGVLHKKTLWGQILPSTEFKPRPFLRLKYLNLAHNELHSLPKEAFAFMPRLVTVDLSGNPLGIIDQLVMGSLSDLTLLRELNLSDCDLQSLPDGLLRRLRKLERLDISYNKFTVLPAVISEAVGLVYLNFDGNPITELSSTSISSLNKLKELSLCGHPRLQTISSGALGGLQSLEVLRICNNPRLMDVAEDFLMWHDDLDSEMQPLLRELYLNNNNLTEISSHYLFRWDQLRDMDFGDNPFVCDCNSQWMVDVLIPYMRMNNASDGNMICHKPKELRGVSFAQLAQESKTLTCPTQNLTEAGAASNTAIVLGVLIGIFLAFPLVLIVVLLWKRGYFAKCRRKMNGSDSEDELERL